MYPTYPTSSHLASVFVQVRAFRALIKEVGCKWDARFVRIGQAPARR